MEDVVLYMVKDNIATITLNRPKSLNSMNDELINCLHYNLDKIENDNNVKCAVLTGNGKAFCAGGDLAYLESITTNAEKRTFIAKVGNVAKRITSIEKPFIAMVNGVTAGAGVNLMLACDLVFATNKAKFAQSFSKVGLIPDCGGLYFLPKTCGLLRAKELMFTADLIDAETAEKYNMVNHLCEDDKLYETTYIMAQHLVNSAPLSIGLIKKYLNNTALTLDEVLAFEESTQALLMGTKDCHEGIKAFKEKRNPIFCGK